MLPSTDDISFRLLAPPQIAAGYLRAESDAGRGVATNRHRASTIARARRASGLTGRCGQDHLCQALRVIARNCFRRQG
jgi:hypothetical protein